MPELPEVEIIVRDLKKKVLQRTFIDVWTDFKKTIRLRQGFDGQVKKPDDFGEFKKKIKGKKILNIRRRGKNIIFDLSDNLNLLIHQKLTGHLLYGIWDKKHGKWLAKEKSWLEEPVNRFIHLMFWLDNGKMLALSDLRKFAKVELWNQEKLGASEVMKNLGPEPLEKSFTFEKFKETLPQKGEIKQILMKQNIIAGIGNVYSDEILFEAKIHPLKEISKLSEQDFKRIYRAIKKILPLAIKLGGESISDYRRLSGEKGYFDKARKIYRREGEECRCCGGIIKRIKLGGRSSHFCPKCQSL